MGRINIRDRILYVYMYTGYIMAKLYWRYKKNGKWTWTAATVVDHVYIERFKRYAKTVLLESEEE